jgi:hypothetical protein
MYTKKHRLSRHPFCRAFSAQLVDLSQSNGEIVTTINIYTTVHSNTLQIDKIRNLFVFVADCMQGYSLNGNYITIMNIALFISTLHDIVYLECSLEQQNVLSLYKCLPQMLE